MIKTIQKRKKSTRKSAIVARERISKIFKNSIRKSSKKIKSKRTSKKTRSPSPTQNSKHWWEQEEIAGPVELRLNHNLPDDVQRKRKDNYCEMWKNAAKSWFNY